MMIELVIVAVVLAVALLATYRLYWSRTGPPRLPPATGTNTSGFRPRTPPKPIAARAPTRKMAQRGPRMKTGGVNVNPTAICLKTGMTVRACGCELHKDIK